MASQDLSYLRFSLEETVRFMRGQEVGELYSISLDPQIHTEEADQFIRMHGFLELSGEYAPSEQHQAEQTGMHGYKYVQQVLERGDNECEFFHHFPIDITIPKSRIAKMEDVEIYIDSFDYEFPEKANLKLTVDLSIAGIMEEEAETERTPIDKTVEVPVEDQPRLKEEVNKKEPEFSILKLDVDTAENLEEQGREADFLVEVKRQPDAPEEEEIPLFSLNEERKEQQKENVSNMNMELVPNESPNVAINESPNLMESSSMSNINMPAHEMKEVMESSPSELAEMNESPSPSPSPSSSSSSEEEEPKKKKKSFSLKKSETMSLADFFARKESEEAVTWKVCLVQREDTLQTIAERYELPVADLVRENKLETNQSIEEGQALYIPTSR
ncbi:hypothetical protein AC623_14085 [Bacillus sp. FJAT-27231]|uniref:stage VI sporulation protein D n=1 Tax=Bacillus sp. FJAT-27231 TaxID=1679168 RepID=UPI0006716A4F|nr:stage VI sporulation protein D [Bacillus sp. FJAT-27231]KMY54925.1 hypothetical protein AC623_14085 [Bacillus sp. FJAT-27231]